jgi:hypothetical protein
MTWDWITPAWEAYCEVGLQQLERERRLTSEELEVALDIVQEGEGPVAWALAVLDACGVTCAANLRGGLKRREDHRSASGVIVCSGSSVGRRRARIRSTNSYKRASWSGYARGRR